MIRLLSAIVTLGLLATQGGCFNMMWNNPARMISAGKIMTGVIMSNMARKRSSDAKCISRIASAAEDFFVDTSHALNLINLITKTKTRSKNPKITSAAVPIDEFCPMVDVGALGAATDDLVSRMQCLGAAAQEDAGRFFSSLVHTVDHVCLDGGKPAKEFIADLRKCRRLDPAHEETLGEVRRLHRSRRSLTAAPRLARAAAVTPAPTMVTPVRATTVPTPAQYTSLQACLDDVNALLPMDAQLSRQEELSDFLMTLPRLIPRLLQENGLAQFCPALLKGGDCAHYSVSSCSSDIQQKMATFFQTVLRGILCAGNPDDATLNATLLYPQVKQLYYNL